MITKLSRTVAVVLLAVALLFAAAVVAPHSHPSPESALLRSPAVLSQSDMLFAQKNLAQAKVRAAEHVITHVSKPVRAHVPRPTPTPTPSPSPSPSPSQTYVPPPVAVPDPGSAQRIAYDLMPSFGFNQTTQFTCLVYLWNRESGWRWNAQEPTSGAYGIPQALPASKMDSAGPDYLTNPRTQIIWGLGYVKAMYVTPCDAWYHDYTDGWY